VREATDRVSIPRDVLERALRKARIEYVRLAQLQGTDPGEEWETWAEFQRLAEYLDA
jgi:trimethylamine:corrinoid methyltransferase-like protein